MGGDTIGVDICDECNSYFGTPIKEMPGSIEEAVKDVFGISRYFSCFIPNRIRDLCLLQLPIL